MLTLRRAAFAAAVVATCLASAGAAADPAPPVAADAPPGTIYLHLVGGGHLTTPGGADLNLPPGYYLDEGSWLRLDAEVRRLQDQETRLTAEVASFTHSASGWRPPWWLLASAALVGAVAGYEAEHYLHL